MFYSNENFERSNNASNYSSTAIPFAVTFWVYLLLLIPSISSAIYALHYLLWTRTLRRAIHNHAIIIFLSIGLIYEATIYPWMLFYYHHQGIWERARLFCTFWIFVDTGLYYTQAIFFAWATVERHILIFHDKWMSTRVKRILIHYVPLVLLSIYCIIYYTITMFFPSCDNTFNNSLIICVDLCLFKSVGLHTYDTIFHQILPILIIVCFSIGLLVRIRLQKRRVGQTLQWRKHWRMTVQLLFVSIIYLIFSFPLTIMSILDLSGVQGSVTVKFTHYALFLNYCTILLCPIASAIVLPQLRNERSHILRFLIRSRAIAPTT